MSATELSIPIDAPEIAAASAILDEPAPGAGRSAREVRESLCELVDAW